MINIAITIGRLGYFGLGIESAQDSQTAASVYLPFTDFSLRGHHEPIEEIASKTSRLMDRDSVKGKQWGEGDVNMNMDIVNSGYLFKMALGNEQLTTGTPNTHLFYTTVSGNTPKTATIQLGRDTDNEVYVGAALDDLTLQVSDKLATLKASLKSHFPIADTQDTVVTTSGTILSFANYTLKFGSDLTAAAAAAATATNEWAMTLSNNVETLHRSGSNDVSTIRSKGFRASGNYTLYFDSVSERDAYYALNKRAMQVLFNGNANETAKVRIGKFRLSEGEITTGLDDFFVIKCKWMAEDVVDALGTRQVDVILQNGKSTVY